MRALIIVDIQNDFVPGGALPVPGGDEIIPVVNELQQQFDLVVATQDWHPPNHKSFASSHPGSKPFDVIQLHNMDQVLWPDHCVQGTKGTDFHSHLEMNRVEAIFRKGMDPETDSYSGFYDNGHLKSTGLAGYLRERRIESVYVCGLAGDYCVYYTSLDALQAGFNVYLIEDATRSINKDAFVKAKDAIVGNGGSVVRSESLLTKKMSAQPR